MPKLYTIYDSDPLQYDDAEIRDILEQYDAKPEDITEELIWQERYTQLEYDTEDFWAEIERAEGLIDGSGFLIEADLGLWNGRRSAWRTTDTLKRAFQLCFADMIDVKVEETSHGKLLVTGYHHDGTNCYEIYRLKEGKYTENSKPARRDMLNVHLRKALRWI